MGGLLMEHWKGAGRSWSLVIEAIGKAGRF